MTWASLFERGEEYDVDLERIRERLQDRREQRDDG
jgi:hypothetical protein